MEGRGWSCVSVSTAAPYIAGQTESESEMIVGAKTLILLEK